MPWIPLLRLLLRLIIPQRPSQQVKRNQELETKREWQQTERLMWFRWQHCVTDKVFSTASLPNMTLMQPRTVSVSRGARLRGIPQRTTRIIFPPKKFNFLYLFSATGQVALVRHLLRVAVENRPLQQHPSQQLNRRTPGHLMAKRWLARKRAHQQHPGHNLE
jgi:hypothetical protein